MSTTYTDHDGERRDALVDLLTAGDHALVSRYGTRPEEWAPVAVAFFAVIARETGDDSREALAAAANAVLADNGAPLEQIDAHGTDAERATVADLIAEDAVANGAETVLFVIATDAAARVAEGHHVDTLGTLATFTAAAIAAATADAANYAARYCLNAETVGPCIAHGVGAYVAEHYAARLGLHVRRA